MHPLQFRDFVLRERAYDAHRRLARHSHEYSNVSVVTGGEILEAAEGGEHQGRCCSVVMKPAGSEHENRIGGSGARTISIEIQAASRFAAEIAKRKWSWFEQPPITRAALALRHAADHGTGLETAAVELVETILSATAPDGGGPPWIAEVKRILTERFAGSIRFDEVARQLGLHPVYLSRAFRRHAGISMTEYVRSLRLNHARHLLTASRRSIAAIAGQSGFSDPSHMSHTFSQMLETTPRCYRRMFVEV